MWRSLKYKLHKITHWEYWPQMLIYAPLTPVYLYYTAKMGTPYFSVAANPSMENGGYMMESKYKIYEQLPQQYIPKTIKVLPTDTDQHIIDKKHHADIFFPCYCKPDIGCKGLGVAKIDNESELLLYHRQSKVSYLIQEAIPYKNEVGIFYCRLPDELNGKITGIVQKEPMEVVGDGLATLQQLIDRVPRYYFQKKFLYKIFNSQLQTIIPKGKTVLLSEIGNHSRGSAFKDVTHLNNKNLEALFDKISKAYNTLYFGRYDIKYNTWEELSEGKNFSIIELNGCGSEPTHLYDSKKSLWSAWSIIIYHWKLLYKIALQNHQKGTAYLSFKEGRDLQKQEADFKKLFT
jgi:hypothetical protein